MTEDKNAFISDLAGLSKPLTKLIETIGEGINILSTPWQIKRNALADAEAISMINASIQEIDGEVIYEGTNYSLKVKKGSIEQAAIQRMIYAEVDRQINLNSIYQKAATILQSKENISAEPVSRDWFVRFRGIAQDISEGEMQQLWARILAGEVETPHTYSYRALDFLKNIQLDEAVVIQKILKHSIGSDEEVLIFGDKDYLTAINIPFVDALLLEELSLASSGLGLNLSPKSQTYFKIIGTKHYIEIENTSDNEESIHVLKLTSLGREIQKLVTSEFEYDTLLKNLEYVNKEIFIFSFIENARVENDSIVGWDDKFIINLNE